MIQFINEQIRTAWEENETVPSAAADDYEWVRRVYLDMHGHIPTSEDLLAFAHDKDAGKRSKLIDKLLSESDYVRNLSTVWANTLIGRNPPIRTSKEGLEKFLRESFTRNRPWNDIVFDMMTAEGHFEEKGEVNFLLAQLTGNASNPEYAVEATAKSAKIFLCMQVQCTQCHNHPFNDWKQDQFWSFNSFLRQIERVDHTKYNAKTGRQDPDYSELVHRDFKGPVHFDTRAGLVQTVYPRYFDREVEDGTDRRKELANLMTKEDINKQLARAMVNRTWAHFFGYGFTRPIDDMGPHNAVSHPDLMERLTAEFVKSGYDVKQLVRWICNSESYNLTSRIGKKNEKDNPANGEVPMFSHMYVKTMDVEQLYESLLIATNAHKSGQGSYEEAQKQRSEWLKEFLKAFGASEGEEPTMFSGTIPQALMMMNGTLTQRAISNEAGGYLRSVLEDPKLKTDQARVNALYLSALGRTPNGNEVALIGKLARASSSPFAAYQDLYWALLNSNEFIVNH